MSKRALAPSVMGHWASLLHVPGQKPSIVLIHGAGCDRHVFDELLPYLTPFELIVPDLPGRGESDSVPAKTVSEAASFIVGLLDALGIEEAIVLGHSFGGAVALELGISHARRVSGLILVSTGARLRVHPAILSAMEAAAAAGPMSLANLPWRGDGDPLRIENVEKHVLRIPSKTTLADWQAANAFDRMAHLKDVACPALVLSGAEDPLTRPKYARYLAENLPDSRICLIEGGGHMLPVENAREVAAEIVSWVRERSGRAPRAL